MGRRPSHEVVSKDVILKAAAQEFIEQGFHGARMDRIAKIGKFNKAMIYYHFKDKQAIYDEVLKSVILRVIGELNAIPNEPASLEEMIGMVYDTYQHLAFECPEYIKLTLYELIRGGPSLKKLKIIKWSNVPFNPINGKIFLFLKKKMKEGAIKKMNVFQLIMTIIGQAITVIILSFMKDVMKDFKLPLNPSLIIDGLLKKRRKFIIDFTMQSLQPKGGK